MSTHLELNLGLGNVLLASASAGDLLGLRDLVPYSLILVSIRRESAAVGAHLSAEILQRISLDGVDAQLGAGLDDSKSAGNYVRISVHELAIVPCSFDLAPPFPLFTTKLDRP